MTIGDEVRVGVELEFHRTASTLSRVFLSHASYLQFACLNVVMIDAPPFYAARHLRRGPATRE
jgi:hypothetical protein